MAAQAPQTSARLCQYCHLIHKARCHTRTRNSLSEIRLDPQRPGSAFSIGRLSSPLDTPGEPISMCSCVNSSAGTLAAFEMGTQEVREPVRAQLLEGKATSYTASPLLPSLRAWMLKAQPRNPFSLETPSEANALPLTAPQPVLLCYLPQSRVHSPLGS